MSSPDSPYMPSTNISKSTEDWYPIEYNPFVGTAQFRRYDYNIRVRILAAKGKLARQRKAFIMFYKKAVYVLLDMNCLTEPIYAESIGRSHKFKVKSNNLIQRPIN